MAVVITVAQQKGGAGKTTLAANLAAALAETHRVAVLDTDPQRSLKRWHALRGDRRTPAKRVGFSDVSGWRLANELERMRRDYDVLIVDSPPQVDTDARVAVRAADLVLVPVQPSPPDLWAAVGTLRIADDEHRKVWLLLNRAPKGGRLRTGVEAEISKGGWPMFNTALGNRTDFAGAFAQGLGVTETAPKSTAAQELRALLAEIEGVLQVTVAA